MALSQGAQGRELDFTRHLAQLSTVQSDTLSYEGSFVASPGESRLVLTNTAEDSQAAIRVVSIAVNGTELAAGRSLQGGERLQLPVQLKAANQVAVSYMGNPTASLRLRVKQAADVSLQIQSRVHFNTQVSNFDEARAFYGQLGFKTLTGFPDTNTQAMARAIGITTPTDYDGSQGEEAGGYLLHGELIGVGGYSGGLVDLIEFSIPRNLEPPYSGLNRLGMARAVMLTANLDADYQHLQAQGVEFMSEPVARNNGSRFVIFSDPDGTFYELREEPDADDNKTAPHLVGLGSVNINVSDYERSLAWYQMLGFEVVQELPGTDSVAVARAMGFSEPYELRGSVIRHPEDGSTLELVQWLHPYDDQPPYPLPVNHLGINRMAFATSDIAADVAMLESQGVEFVSPITPCCSGPDSPGSIVAFLDPDGTVIELVEQPFMTQFMAVLAWFRNLFD